MLRLSVRDSVKRTVKKPGKLKDYIDLKKDWKEYLAKQIHF